MQFITSLLKPEFDSYGVELPSQALADLSGPTLYEQIDECTAEATEQVRQTGLTELSDDWFYTDLGLVDVPVDETEPKDAPTLCSEALRIGPGLLETVACRKLSTHAADALKLSTQKGQPYRPLTRLKADLKEHVLAGRVDGHTAPRLFEVASLDDKEQQRAAFSQLLREAPKPRDRLLSLASNAAKQRVQPSEPKQARVVAHFNSPIFARQRWRAQSKVAGLEAQVERLNQRLQNPRSHLTPKGALGVIEDRLRHHDLLSVFEVKTETVNAESGSFSHVRLTRNEAQWHRRRSFDGFSVLVAHPKIQRSGAEPTRTYRAKNAVEADFQVIKSVVKLRPVRHRTDVKVRAHRDRLGQRGADAIRALLRRELTALLRSTPNSSCAPSRPLATLWNTGRTERPPAPDPLPI